MQDNPSYRDVVGDVHGYLAARIEACEAAGMEKSRLAIDPGLGFGKTAEHNHSLIANLSVFADLGCPVVLGASRKSFLPGAGPKGRLAGSLAAALAGVARGASILRVHDVAETAQALEVWRSVLDAPEKK